MDNSIQNVNSFIFRNIITTQANNMVKTLHYVNLMDMNVL